MITPYKGTRVPIHALWKSYLENSKGLIMQVQQKNTLPALIEKFEDFFKENGYIYERPMTNDDFVSMSPDNTPVGIENYKTAYTNHYLQYKKCIAELENSDTAIKEFVIENKSLLPHLILSAISTLLGLSLPVLLVKLLL